MSSTDVEPRAAIDWYWRPTNQVRAILEALGEAGILGLARRDGNRRVYDLVERLFPAEILEQRVPVREQFRHKLLSRYRAHGLLGMTGQRRALDGLGAVGRRPATRTGCRSKSAGRRVLQSPSWSSAATSCRSRSRASAGCATCRPTELARLDAAEREVAAGSAPGGAAPGVAFLAALDPLVWDRDLLRSLYDFDYLWEVYVPAAKRRWGYYVLPILFGDRLVGRIEPRIERQDGHAPDRRAVVGGRLRPARASPGSSRRSREPIDAHRAFGGVHGWRGRGRAATGSSGRGRSGRGLERGAAARSG